MFYIATILSSGDFRRCGWGERFFARALGFPLPKHLLVFSCDLHAFTHFYIAVFF